MNYRESVPFQGTQGGPCRGAQGQAGDGAADTVRRSMDAEMGGKLQGTGRSCRQRQTCPELKQTFEKQSPPPTNTRVVFGVVVCFVLFLICQSNMREASSSFRQVATLVIFLN